MEEQKTVIVTTTLFEDEHAVLKADAESKGQKFGFYVANLLRNRVAQLQKATAER